MSEREDRDLRGWIGQLEAAGELARVGAEVDWRGELAAVCRRVLNAQGPALLFENIRDYRDGRCRRLFTGGSGSPRHIALALNRPKDTPRRELVGQFRQAVNQPLEPRVVATGAVKQNVLTGDAINLLELPVPHWHEHDGGRYINTWCGVVTRDPDTGVHNVGMYRGMISSHDRIAVLMLLSQGWGHHFVKYAERGQPMPVAFVYGWDPTLFICSASQLPKDCSEYGVAGALRGSPVPLVKCESSDLLVPASAEIVVEGVVTADPAEMREEGPFGEYTGYYGGTRRPRHTVRVEAICHRDDAIYEGSLEGAGPGEPNEDSHVYALTSKALMLEVLERAGVPGVLDCRPGPVNLVKIRQSYRGHAKQVAAALWGSWAAEWMWKVVVVVDEDIDIYNERSIQWAICYRTDPGPKDYVVYPDNRGGALDPSTSEEEKNDVQFGTGRWNRILIDATRDLSTATRDRFGRPVWIDLSTHVPAELKAQVEARWKEYGIHGVR